MIGLSGKEIHSFSDWAQNAVGDTVLVAIRAGLLMLVWDHFLVENVAQLTEIPYIASTGLILVVDVLRGNGHYKI